MEQRISIERLEQAINLFGSFDENIRLIESEFHVTVANREGELRVNGEPEDTMLACKALSALLTLSNRGEAINEQNVRYVIGLARSGQEEKIGELTQDVICISAKGRPIKPKTIGQKEYVDSISQNTVTIGVGPAGTGKTYLAVAAAVAAFRERKINRIILTRPAVEAGERLGFLPGDLQSKVDPYLRPLYDALFDMLGAETYQKYLERGNIEVAPLAYMRGRTLDDSFIILDEAQNTSCEQMKMFLTRMGFGSKMVITGDATQIDLPADKLSGLKQAVRVLKNVEGIGICELTDQDVVRHVMVQRIIKAYADAFIRKVIRTALAAEGVDFPCEIDVRLTNDETIHAINREMRQVDRATDVLSFPMFELTPGELPGEEDADPGTGLVPLGDMVISLEHVAAQAKEYGHSNRRELAYLVTHSVLHLLGYDHLDEGPMKAQMREHEEAIMKRLDLER